MVSSNTPTTCLAETFGRRLCGFSSVPRCLTSSDTRNALPVIRRQGTFGSRGQNT
jgi:hypothetical protein